MSLMPASPDAKPSATRNSTLRSAKARRSSTTRGSMRRPSLAGSTRCRCKPIREMSMRGSADNGRTALLLAAMAAAGFAFTVYVFYPGILTFDSLYIYKDIAKFAFGDWQSPVFMALWLLIDPIAPGPGSIFLLTAALYWFAFAIIAVGVARQSRQLALLVPVLAISPPAFVLVGVIWRDMLFGVSWLLAAGLVFAVLDRGWKVRVLTQICAVALLAFGVLLRPNALAAAPLLMAYLVWPSRFSWKRTALLYVPAALGLFGVMQVTYYGVFAVERQHPLHSIMVFDLGGISHFAGENVFPGSWTPAETALITEECYKPVAWNIYWTQERCRFVMAQLEADNIFSST